MCSLHSLGTTQWSSYKTTFWSPHLLECLLQPRPHNHTESNRITILLARKRPAMTNTTKTSPKGGVASTLMCIPKFFGFSKAYNFILFFIFGGAMFGFGLARFMYIDIPGILCGPLPGQNRASPGECYYYENFDQYKVGIRLHLYTILRMLPCQY